MVSWTSPPLVLPFGGLSLQCRTQGSGCLMCAETPCSSEKNSIFLRSLPVVGHHVGHGGFCLSYPSQCSPFILCCGSAFHLFFKIFFRGNYSICSCKSVVAMGRGGFRFFLCQPSLQGFTKMLLTDQKLTVNVY